MLKFQVVVLGIIHGWAIIVECKQCGHTDGLRHCQITRQSKPAVPGRGHRPLGLLLAWLERPCSDKHSHYLYSVPGPPFDRRGRARNRFARTTPELYKKITYYEREQHDGEGLEPLEFS